MIASFAAVDNGQSPATLRTHTEQEGHGRVETRRTKVMAVPATLRNQKAWQDIASIARCTRTYTERGVENQRCVTSSAVCPRR